ncbi:RNA methyltransferase [Sporosarcina thermotolerans]|uniref:RNA methyltransferase n=1 Tax=Sporosarcina thermotolerans TaxID=633404 RepID=A0AAW9A4Y2_9BACL|nr:THUMP domain-containing protein [Sporosarcina thermotolerans]MDW0116002.1 RNA methyltransferase [Sporosarcina thermotolerans]WHT49812.1 RNA methyltransferase [Sporosarcina thermotolerans]
MKHAFEVDTKKFIYTYVRQVDEHDLCRLEMRAFFGYDSPTNVITSKVKIDPSRSPFIRERLEVIFSGKDLDEIKGQATEFVTHKSFKVTCLNSIALNMTPKLHHPERRSIEREIGEVIQGEADLHEPEVNFGIVLLDEVWYFGIIKESEPIWRFHMKKPHMYSTALSTRVARAVANIAVPHPEGIRAIDPCCGIGTVLVEARSMGIDIVGRDINPLVCLGSRKNLAHFGLEGEVVIGPISEVTNTYDAAIIDMPYNLFTHITAEGQLNILKDARRITSKLVVVTIEPMDHMITEAGFEIVDRCIAKKGTFERQIVVCE